MKWLFGVVSVAGLALAAAVTPQVLAASSGSACDATVTAGGGVNCIQVDCTTPCSPQWIPPANQNPPPAGNQQVMWCTCPGMVNGSVCAAGATWDFDQQPPVFVSADCWNSRDRTCPAPKVCKKVSSEPMTRCDCVD